MKLAFFSPFNPIQSGISDYSEELLSALRAGRSRWANPSNRPLHRQRLQALQPRSICKIQHPPGPRLRPSRLSLRLGDPPDGQLARPRQHIRSLAQAPRRGGHARVHPAPPPHLDGPQWRQAQRIPVSHGIPLWRRRQRSLYAAFLLGQFPEASNTNRTRYRRAPETRFNREWLGALGADGVVRLAATYNVARMLERRDFRQRYRRRPAHLAARVPLSPGQAYDSVALKADVELGGTDQLFNLNVGRDIMPAYGLRAAGRA